MRAPAANYCVEQRLATYACGPDPACNLKDPFVSLFFDKIPYDFSKSLVMQPNRALKLPQHLAKIFSFS